MTPALSRVEGLWVGTFEAMASPCEVLLDVDDRDQAQSLVAIVAEEASRIERKFSRYLPDSIVSSINRAGGEAIEVDDETARLLDLAGRLYELSDGGFDITSGVLGRLWRFDGRARAPAPAKVAEVLESVGWQRVRWSGGRIRLEPGQQIDFGGIGKEYAADRAAALVAQECSASCLVNLGGDLTLSSPRFGREPWRVGIESLASAGAAQRLIELTSGALATSGDTKRYLLADGVRYGHILDPRTGWPVRDAPRSVTVAAGSCTQAGMLATLAMLEGSGAESFLEQHEVRHWILR